MHPIRSSRMGMLGKCQLVETRTQAFSSVAPALWHILPSGIRIDTTLLAFCKALKDPDCWRQYSDSANCQQCLVLLQARSQAIVFMAGLKCNKGRRWKGNGKQHACIHASLMLHWLNEQSWQFYVPFHLYYTSNETKHIEITLSCNHKGYEWTALLL